MAKRPDNIIRWRDNESATEGRHPATCEMRSFRADLGTAAGLTRLAVIHERLAPGRRTSPPHAERDEEELVLVLEGAPDLWQDGHLYRVKPGVAVFWPARTGTAHAILNNSDADVRLLIVGECSRYRSKVAFPCDLKCAEWFSGMGKLWTDPPRRRLGPHDGLPDAVHGTPPPKGAYKTKLPPNAFDWRTLPMKTDTGYPGDTEKMADFTPFNRLSGLGRIGGGIDTVLPGRRTSYPHAEGDEEELTFVLEGTLDLWQNGRLYPLHAGDFVGWPNRTGTAHTLINNGAAPAILATFGEASLQRSRVWYPFNARHAKTIGDRAWTPSQRPKFGPHDGMPDALRPKRGKRK